MSGQCGLAVNERALVIFKLDDEKEKALTVAGAIISMPFLTWGISAVVRLRMV